MNLHEYQAKKILSENGLPIPKGYIIKKIEEIKNIKKELKKNKSLVLKCQIHAGGRGKVGGVKIVNDLNEINLFFKKWLNKKLITNQTDKNGQIVKKILIEQTTKFNKEIYVAVLIDKNLCKITFIASTQGGVEIEEIAKKTPELIKKVIIDHTIGPMEYQGRELGFKLGIENKLISKFVEIFTKLVNIFIKNDLELIEINPLVITEKEEFVCLDSKIIIDNNALYRQEKLKNMQDKYQQNKREYNASKWDLNYVQLNGNIGCMVNGAGLAMATMDMIKFNGGIPANFLDVGGNTNKEKVKEAFKIILSDKKINSILINIFGGIVRCDLIADGIIEALKEIKISIPIIIRLEGNNSEVGIKKLTNSSLNITVAKNLTDAAKKAIIASRM